MERQGGTQDDRTLYTAGQTAMASGGRGNDGVNGGEAGSSPPHIANPSFETGDFTGWTTTGALSVVTSYTTQNALVYGPTQGTSFALGQTQGDFNLDGFFGLAPGTFPHVLYRRSLLLHQR